MHLIKNKDKFYHSSINWAKKFEKKKISEKFAEVYNKIEKIKEAS